MKALFERWDRLTPEERPEAIATAAAFLSELPIQVDGAEAPAWLHALSRLFASSLKVSVGEVAVAATGARAQSILASILAGNERSPHRGARDETEFLTATFHGLLQTNWRRRLADAVANSARASAEFCLPTGLPIDELKAVRFSVTRPESAEASDPRQLANDSFIEVGFARRVGRVTELLANVFVSGHHLGADDFAQLSKNWRAAREKAEHFVEDDVRETFVSFTWPAVVQHMIEERFLQAVDDNAEVLRRSFLVPVPVPGRDELVAMTEQINFRFRYPASE